MKYELIQSPRDALPAAFKATAGPTKAELEYYRRRAHCLRSAALKRVFRGAGAAVGRGFRALVRGLSAAHERRRAAAELNRLDNRTLRDIGIDRSQIPFIVEQLMARRRADGDPGKVYPLSRLTAPSTAGVSLEDDERCPPLAA